MRIYTKALAFLFVGLFFLVFTSSSFASSNTFSQSAYNYYQTVCSKTNVIIANSVICYVFDKVNELDASLTSLTSRVANLENQAAGILTTLSSLGSRLTILETKVNQIQTPTLTPTPTPPLVLNCPDLYSGCSVGSICNVISPSACSQNGGTFALCVCGSSCTGLPCQIPSPTP